MMNMFVVRDCEHIRKELLSDKENPEDRKWSILGQSFGGFCALTYLSFFPDGLKEAFLTGGLAPISTAEPDPVYERTLSECCWLFVAQKDDTSLICTQRG